VDRLTRLRDSLNVPSGRLPDAAIQHDPWAASGRLRDRAATSLPEHHPLRRAAEDFVSSLSRSLGDLKPDMIIWDPATGTVTVIDATHTVGTQFAVFHEFKTMLYARIFAMITGRPVTGIEFRTPRQQRTF
jgi:hypothetical protein